MAIASDWLDVELVVVVVDLDTASADGKTSLINQGAISCSIFHNYNQQNALDCLLGMVPTL